MVGMVTGAVLENAVRRVMVVCKQDRESVTAPHPQETERHVMCLDPLLKAKHAMKLSAQVCLILIIIIKKLPY